MPNILNASNWYNPKNIVGNFSAGKLTTNTSPNYAYTDLYSNNLNYVGPNQWPGTNCNKLAAQGKYVGGKKKIFTHNKKMRKTSKKAGMKIGCGCTKYGGGSVSAKYLPGKVTGNQLKWASLGGYKYQKSKSSELAGKVSSKKKTKKRRRHPKKKSHKKSHKMRGGLFGLFGKKSKRGKGNYQPSGFVKPSPYPLAPEMKAGKRRGRKTRRGGGYAFNPDIKHSALANPMPFKSYNSCKTIKVRN
jgi:hypothetical protein